MTRRIGTEREVASLLAAADYCEQQGLPLAKELKSLHAKITRPKPATTSSNIGGIEHELVTLSAGRVVPAKGGPPFWIAQSRKYGEMGANPEEAAIVGAWLARQAWMRDRVYTVDSLAKWWPNYLARAKADGQKGANVEWTRPEFDGEDGA